MGGGLGLGGGLGETLENSYNPNAHTSGCRPAVSDTSCCVQSVGWSESLEGGKVPEATQTLCWLWAEGVVGMYTGFGGWCHQLDGEG